MQKKKRSVQGQELIVCITISYSKCTSVRYRLLSVARFSIHHLAQHENLWALNIYVRELSQGDTQLYSTAFLQRNVLLDQYVGEVACQQLQYNASDFRPCQKLHHVHQLSETASTRS